VNRVVGGYYYYNGCSRIADHLPLADFASGTVGRKQIIPA
jgi:hypothetical protein